MSTTLAPPPRVRVALALAKSDLGLSLPSELVDDDVIVKGTKHKMQILQDYEAEFGANYPKLIITRRTGKHSHELDIVTPTCMSPSIKKYYWIQELTFYNVITMVIKEYRSSFNCTDLHNLSIINHNFSKMIPNTIWLLQLDFSPLRERQYNYKSKAKILSGQADMASAAMIHFGLDPGKRVRWLGGKYTGEHRNIIRTLTAVKDHVSSDNFNHMTKGSLGADLRRTSSQQILDDPTRKFKKLQQKPRASHQYYEQGGPLQPRPTSRQTSMHLLSILPPYNSDSGNQTGEE